MTAPLYEIFALKYAHRDGRRALHFVGGDPHDAPMPMDYFIWLVRNAERTVLVDTGFDAAMAGGRNRTLVRTPAAALALIGVAAAAMRDVVITHLHNDHVGRGGTFRGASIASLSIPRAGRPARHRIAPPTWSRCSAPRAPGRMMMRTQPGRTP